MTRDWRAAVAACTIAIIQWNYAKIGDGI